MGELCACGNFIHKNLVFLKKLILSGFRWFHIIPLAREAVPRPFLQSGAPGFLKQMNVLRNPHRSQKPSLQLKQRFAPERRIRRFSCRASILVLTPEAGGTAGRSVVRWPTSARRRSAPSAKSLFILRRCATPLFVGRGGPQAGSRLERFHPPARERSDLQPTKALQGSRPRQRIQRRQRQWVRRRQDWGDLDRKHPSGPFTVKRRILRLVF